MMLPKAGKPKSSHWDGATDFFDLALPRAVREACAIAASQLRPQGPTSVAQLAKLFVLFALGIAAGPAQSRSLQIAGTAGYLSEWELKGEVTETISAGGQELSGPLVWTHIGLCSVNGPEEKPGEINVRISKAGAVAKIEGTILFNGARCSYNGRVSGSSSGYMDCSDASGIPLSFSIK